MCYEFSEWGWKARAAELARKQREAEKASKTESKPEPVTPAAPQPRLDEREKVPA
jgi:hypothetical protein